METRIGPYSRITRNSARLNGGLLLANDALLETPAFLSLLYKQLDPAYPKFFKMDTLCKLGFLGTELVVKNIPGFAAFPKHETALVFSNQSSSIESDRAHAASIGNKESYFPSPAVFVYTLPNIVLGELAIRHQLSGENAFFISEAFDEQLLFNYTSLLLEQTTTSALLCGWINADKDRHDAFVYCVKKANFNEPNDGFTVQHSPENIRQLYQS